VAAPHEPAIGPPVDEAVQPQGVDAVEPQVDVAAVAALAEAEAVDLLRHGGLEIEGRLVDASNATLRAFVSHDGLTARCVYKPVRGERPLWDFPDGTLAGREVAAYALSAAGSFDVVPPTVLRDGPLGLGMCQLWIDEERQDAPPLGFVPARRVPDGWRRVASATDERGRPYALAHADDPRLARMAVFDAVINNGDRKGAHVLATVEGRLYGVDHGVCLHVDNKLRTVLWGWVAEPLPADAVERLERLRAARTAGLDEALAAHLTTAEIAAFGARLDHLLDERRFPPPSPDWPAIPWPPI
jgi:uncharacterized repeat protein (TIGR03843 family)